jgi:Domain of unknown function (DUF3883)
MVEAIRGSDWSVEEVELCVSNYFKHLELELIGRTFNKAQLYRNLAQKTGRTPSSIEFKFQNISAVLDAMSREWMKGLAPLANYQELLADKVGQHIESLDSVPLLNSAPLNNTGLAEAAAFYFEPPPELRRRERLLPDFIERLVKKFDPVARDLKNRAVGEAGEEFVFNFEKRYLKLIGRKDLSDNVRWVAKEDGDGAGYDILSFTDRGDKKFVEVKTTVGGSRSPFFVSRNEYDFCKSSDESYRLVRLFDFRKGVRGFELKGQLENYVKLSTETFRAEFTQV